MIPSPSLQTRRGLAAVILAGGLLPGMAQAQGTGFTYQGRLDSGGAPATGLYDLEFRVFDAATNGLRLGPVVAVNDLPVTNGVFSAVLDFGSGVFTGGGRWLELAVRPGDSAEPFVGLWPRQPVTASPYAIFAGGAPAAGLVGTLPAGALSGSYSGAVQFTNPASVFAGNAGGLTNLNAASLAGAVPDARLSRNVALLDRSPQIFSGDRQSFAGQVGVGVTDPQAPLHVYSDQPVTTLRVQSAAGPGAGKVEFWSDPLGGANEWRPGSILSLDQGGYTGGLAFLVNGSGFNHRTREQEAMRIVNGRVGIGATNLGARLQVQVASGPTNVGLFVGDRAPFGSAMIQTDFNQTNVTHAWFAERGQEVFSVANGGQGYFKGNVGIGTTVPRSKLQIVTSSGPTNVGLFLGDRGPFGSAVIQTDFNQSDVTHAWFAEFGSVVFSVANGGQGYFKGNVGIGTTAPRSKLEVIGEVSCTALNLTSDRNAKEGFRPVDAREVLDKVARLPITEWQYKTQGDARHIGPMAQDFHAAFALGRDDRHISAVDQGGVALAAIQGLNAKLEETRAENAELRRMVEELRTSLRGGQGGSMARGGVE